MQALTEYMKVTGLDQRGLAHRLGVNETQLSAWLNKRRAPSVTNLKQIAERTGISLEKLAQDL